MAWLWLSCRVMTPRLYLDRMCLQATPLWLGLLAAAVVAVAPQVFGETLTQKPRSTVNGAVGVAPTEAQAEAAYDAARKLYANGGVASAGKPGVVVTDGTVAPNPYERAIPGGKNPANVSLNDIRLVLDAENTSLRDIFGEIVTQAAEYTGPWTVKWRLKPENMGLLDERVNLTAEAKFSEFVALLTERVRNMSGVQLYVTAFHDSRLILVTDTYY